MNKFSEKAKCFIDLSTRTDLTKAEKQKLHDLHRLLSAKGLDPAHEKGLLQRALVLDHKTKCANFVAMRDDDKRVFAKANELADLGIKPDKQQLSRILREIEAGAKDIDKKKSSRRNNVSPARAYADKKLAEFEAEIADTDENAEPVDETEFATMA